MAVKSCNDEMMSLYRSCNFSDSRPQLDANFFYQTRFQDAAQQEVLKINTDFVGDQQQSFNFVYAPGPPSSVAQPALHTQRAHSSQSGLLRRALQPIDTNSWQPAVQHNPPGPPDIGSCSTWFPYEMSTSYQVNSKTWPGHEHECYQPFSAPQYTTCPSLVTADHDDASPTTSPGSWMTFSPAPNFEDSKPVFDFSARERCMYDSRRFCPKDAPLSFRPAVFGMNDVDSQSGRGNPVYIQEDVPDMSHLTCPTVTGYISSFPGVEHLPNVCIFAHVPAKPILTQMCNESNAGVLPSQPNQQPEHIYPGLLSRSFGKDTAAVYDDGENISIRSEDTAMDQAIPSASGDATTTTPSTRDDPLTQPSLPSNRQRNLQSSEDRSQRDNFLLQCRRKGLSYREIKRKGGFSEAESTLRGRIRILSKPKHQRVRKPQWRLSDITLLRRAISSLSKNPPSTITTTALPLRPNPTITASTPYSSSSSKPPWKKVAEWMHTHGSSYPFAPATCAKKWDEINSYLID